MRGVNVSALSLKSCTACLGYTQKEIICATTNPAYFLTSAHLASPCEVVVDTVIVSCNSDTGKVWARGFKNSAVYGLWSRLKHLKNYFMDLHYMWYRYSWCQEDLSYDLRDPLTFL